MIVREGKYIVLDDREPAKLGTYALVRTNSPVKFNGEVISRGLWIENGKRFFHPVISQGGSGLTLEELVVEAEKNGGAVEVIWEGRGPDDE